MKKTKFLALALVVALALSGAGYAYWTETLTVDTTINTGMLDFKFAEGEVTGSKGMDYGNHVSKAAPNNGGKNEPSKLDVTLYDMFPGAETTIKFDIKNVGTLDGKVEGLKLVDESVVKYADMIFVKSLKVNGVDQFDGDPINISDLDLKDLSVPIAKDSSKTFRMTLSIAGCEADETTFPELLGTTGRGPIRFAIETIGKQYNDDGCDDGEGGGETDPVLIGRRFEGYIVDSNGKIYDGTYEESESEVQTATLGGVQYFIKGAVLNIYDNDDEKVIEYVTEEIDFRQQNATVDFEEFDLEFDITWSRFLLVWYPSNLNCEIVNN